MIRLIRSLMKNGSLRIWPVAVWPVGVIKNRIP